MRTATVTRNTKETEIAVTLFIDGDGKVKTDTNIGFFDHMLTALGMHAGWDLKIDVTGDLYVDCHHTIEDTGIVLGQAIKKALSSSPVARYGNAMIPMDEVLGQCVLDISGRPFLVFDCPFQGERIGDMDTQMVEEFFRAVAFHAGITLHLTCPYGKNDHHKVEALFKAFAHAIAMAQISKETVLSTKGALDL